MSGFANAVVGGAGTLIRKAIKSPDYAPGSAGWSINQDGSAEFNNATFRGTIEAAKINVESSTADDSGIYGYDSTPKLIFAFTNEDYAALDETRQPISITTRNQSTDYASAQMNIGTSGAIFGGVRQDGTTVMSVEASQQFYLQTPGNPNNNEDIYLVASSVNVVNPNASGSFNVFSEGANTFSVNPFTGSPANATPSVQVPSGTNLEVGAGNAGQYCAETYTFTQNILNAQLPYVAGSSCTLIRSTNDYGEILEPAASAWVVPVEGWYMITAYVYYTAWTAGSYTVMALTNAYPYSIGNTLAGFDGTSGNGMCTFAVREYLAANEALYLWLQQTTGSTRTAKGRITIAREL